MECILKIGHQRLLCELSRDEGDSRRHHHINENKLTKLLNIYSGVIIYKKIKNEIKKLY